jgi:hypothetical protein
LTDIKEEPSQADAKDENRKNKVKKTHLGSVQTAILWTKNQLDVLQRDAKKVLFIADYGSGKTLLLKTKALTLANKLKEQQEKELDQGLLLENESKQEQGEEQAYVINNKLKRLKLEYCLDPENKSEHHSEEEQVFFVSFAELTFKQVFFLPLVRNINLLSFLFKCAF